MPYDYQKDEYIDVKDIGKDKTKRPGFLSRLGGGLKSGLETAGQRYKEYKAKAPERREAKMKRLGERIEEAKQKKALYKEQQELQGLKSERFKNMPSFGSVGGFGGSPFGQSRNKSMPKPPSIDDVMFPSRKRGGKGRNNLPRPFF